jgi:alkylhydroperoxidase/carboxymuconolactone decarboxylase family protein
METYYDPADLAAFGGIGKDAPELAKKFFDYYAEVFKEGELTEREKALIALAVAHAVQCPYCIGVPRARERVEPGRDDRGGHVDGDPGGALSCTGADAEDRRNAFHVGRG